MDGISDMPGLKFDSDTSDSDTSDSDDVSWNANQTTFPVDHKNFFCLTRKASASAACPDIQMLGPQVSRPIGSRLSSFGHQQVRREFGTRCILCLGEVELHPDTKIPCSIACPSNHFIHRQCLDSLIINRCEKVLHTPSTSSHIDCPACTGDRETAALLSKRTNPVQVQSYTEEQLKHASGGACQKALDLLESVAKADLDLAALPEDEQIMKGNTDGYLCPKCNFGPVAHKACADLASHHDHGGISNKCPKCGFLASIISEWIRISAPEKIAIRSRFSCIHSETEGWPSSIFPQFFRPPRLRLFCHELPENMDGGGRSSPLSPSDPAGRRFFR
jgi:hypothetical protein